MGASAAQLSLPLDLPLDLPPDEEEGLEALGLAAASCFVLFESAGLDLSVEPFDPEPALSVPFSPFSPFF